MKVLEHGIGLVIHDVWGSKQGSLVQSIMIKIKAAYILLSFLKTRRYRGPYACAWGTKSCLTAWRQLLPWAWAWSPFPGITLGSTGNKWGKQTSNISAITEPRRRSLQLLKRRQSWRWTLNFKKRPSRIKTPRSRSIHTNDCNESLYTCIYGWLWPRKY